jgi:hypothetical protein
MGKLTDAIDKVIEKVKELLTPPEVLVPVPIPIPRPRRR